MQGSTTHQEHHSPDHALAEGKTDDVVRLLHKNDDSLAPRLQLNAATLLATANRSEVISRVKRVSAKAYSIYAITEQCADQGDYTETHNEHIGHLALEMYEALQELGIRISE